MHFSYVSQLGLFLTYEIVLKGIMVMGDNAACKIASIGRDKIKMFDGTFRTLNDVGYVLDL